MTRESYNSYYNAFLVAGMSYYSDLYVHLKMARFLNLMRVGNGEPKYLIFKLMATRYLDIPISNKNPMPSPPDKCFENCNVPKYKVVNENLDISIYSGKQKWQPRDLETWLSMNKK